MKLNKSQVVLIILTLGSIILAFVSYKAYSSSFTHDESYTYLAFVHDSFMDILSFSNWYTNNHILNSIFIKYAEILFGNSELALRLPNLLLLVVYMYYGYQLFKDSKPFLTITIFTLLITSIPLLELFGLARGYGMSYGFMLMSFFHFISYNKDSNKKDLILFHLGALLASLSSFTMVTFYVALLIVYNAQLFINTKLVRGEKFRFFQINKVHIIPLIVVVAVLFEPIRRVISHSDLNFGGKSGFYVDTVFHLIVNTLHGESVSVGVLVLLKVVFTAVVIIPLILIIVKSCQKEPMFFTKHSGLITSTFLMVLISVIIIMQHIILKSDYPVSRFSVFLVPLIIIQFGFLIDYLCDSGFVKVSLIVMSGLSLISVFSFLTKANLEATIEWKFDANTKNMLQTLDSIRIQNGNNPQQISLGINWQFEPTINFYKETKELDWLGTVDRNGYSETDDFIYIFEKEFQTLEMEKYEVVKSYENSGTILIKNK